jgi:cytoskeletal protein CcmA (bactofilin family)
LKSTCNVEGEVRTQKLIVEAGATFNAQCKMQSAEEGVKKLTDTHEKTA